MSRLPTSFEVNIPGCFLAGGSILSTVTRAEINDYDIYPKTNEAMIEAFYQLFDEGCFVVNISDRAVTFKSNTITNDKKERAIIQVMTYDTFETAEKIFEHFDFSVCMGAFDYDSKTYTFHEDFYHDIASKNLRFNPKTRYPLNSMLRVNKYHSKGFFVSKMELIRIMLTVIERGAPTSWEELESQIGGVYGRQIRINEDDVPFSMQAAMDKLEKLSFLRESELGWLCNFRSDDEGTTAEDLETLFSNELVNVVVAENGDHYKVSDDFKSPIKNLGNVLPRVTNIINTDSEHRFVGYKILQVNSDGTLTPGIQTSSKLRYSVGQETSESKSPYLFVFPTCEKAMSRSRCKGSKIFRVSYDAKDLRKISHGEIQVTKMLVEEEVLSDGL